MNKEYIKPTMNVVKIQHQSHLLGVSSVSTNGVDDLGYEETGGDQGNAW